VDFTALKCKYSYSDTETIYAYKKIGERITQEKSYKNLDELKKRKGFNHQKYSSRGVQDDCILDPEP
jgi:hypothetical protein